MGYLLRFCLCCLLTFFTQPLYSLKVYDKSYIITFIVMLCSSIIASTQTSKLIHSKDLANEREKQSHILYRVTSSLAKTSELSEVATVTAQCLSNLFDCNVTCILLDKKIIRGKSLRLKKEIVELSLRRRIWKKLQIHYPIIIYYL